MPEHTVMKIRYHAVGVVHPLPPSISIRFKLYMRKDVAHLYDFYSTRAYIVNLLQFPTPPTQPVAIREYVEERTLDLPHQILR